MAMAPQPSEIRAAVGARCPGFLLILFALLPALASAQNTTPGASVHLLVGQSPMVVTLPTGSATRWYSAEVVAERSYCAEATASETEVNATDPVLTVYREDATTVIGANDNTTIEPKGQTAARVCFIAPVNNSVYLAIAPASAGFENRGYLLRFVETTLWTNWFFTGGDYSSFTLLRNTTNTPVSTTIRWKAANGLSMGTPQVGLQIPANGVVVFDARGAMACPYPTPCPAPSGSVEVAHTGSPEAIVGSQTTLSGSTGLSFDTIFFQRRAW
jgi:hypothetical protein